MPHLQAEVFWQIPTARTDMMTNAWEMPRGRGGMGTLGIDWAISLTTSPLHYYEVYQHISITATVFFLLLWGPLREVTLVWILKPVISHIEEETIAVAVSTYLCVVCHIFCFPITLFKGYVTWQNFTLTGPVPSAYLLNKNTNRNDKVKYTECFQWDGTGSQSLLLPAPSSSVSCSLPTPYSPRPHLPVPLHYELWGSVKCRLRTDCGLLFLGLENNGTIVVSYSFAWCKQ